MKNVYLAVSFLINIVAYCQEDNTTFHSAITENIGKYNMESNLAYKEFDFERGKILFDSLVINHLKGTSFDDFTYKSFEKKKLKLSDFKKPVFLLTYASWYVPNKGQVPAINKLAQKYKEIKFVILFWDKKRDVKKIANKFNHNITICYANESYANDAPIIANLKHPLGFPTSYFLDENLKVVDIKRANLVVDKDSNYTTAYTLNYDSFREGLSCLLLDKNKDKVQLSDK